MLLPMKFVIATTKKILWTQSPFFVLKIFLYLGFRDLLFSNKLLLNQLHAVSRTQQGRQKEPKVLRQSVPHFCRIREALRVEWQNSTPLFASTPERRNNNINLSKYFISSSGDQTHYQSVLQSHFGITQ